MAIVLSIPSREAPYLLQPCFLLLCLSSDLGQSVTAVARYTIYDHLQLQSLQFNQELLSNLSMPCAEGQASIVRTLRPLLGVSLAATYENLLSSLQQAAALVSTPTGETEAVSHHCQGAPCEKRPLALYSYPFLLGLSCPARPQRCSLLLCPVSIIRTQKDSCIPVAS